ncbi:hypothetical protein ABIB40_003275 [Pedobacter sp. UYP30]|uniref:TonB-dependent receptor n=1 Tax=Pedobacter sp. UYP30 TaxID=1756400 RepID=UPI003390D542
MKSLLRVTIMVFVVAICSHTANAQNAPSVSGKVINAKDKTPVELASVAIRSLKDSSIVATGQTDANGVFKLKALPPGKYRIYTAYLGLKPLNKDFELTDKPINLGDLALLDDGLDLNTVDVTATIPVVVKQDTIEFDAKSIKTRENAVVEDVLKKLPGVEVAKDGSIKAQGETITKVKVDGKEFFGSDPLLATKNLPADMVDKIQIIDEQSEQAKFSGVDDGARSKILNITTKSSMKKGYFGNSSLGYGTNDRYDGNINVNKFDNDQQISFIGQFNNVNKQNFGGGGGRGNRFGGGGGSGSGGITTTNAAGLNFGDTYKDGTQIQGSYFFNKSSALNNQNSFTQNLLGNTITTVANNSNNNTNTTNNRFNFMVDTKLGETASLKIQPNISYTENDGVNQSTYDRNLLQGHTIGLQNYNTKATTPNVSNNLLLRKKFKRRGRTISLNVNTSIGDNDSKNKNYIFENISTPKNDTTKLTNQLNNLGNNSIGNTSRLVYTEPISKTLSMEFNYQNGFNRDNQDRAVLNFNPASGMYDVVDSVYSNVYQNRTLTNAVGFSLSKTERKYNLNIGVAGQQTNRINSNLTTGLIRTQNFINLTPNANFRYNFSNSKRLSIRYRGNTQQPSISQIQPIPDNTNTQTIFIGNPTLRPSFNNNLNFRYNNFDFAHYRIFFAYLDLNQTFNAIGNNNTLITDVNDANYGKIATTYVNVGGVYSGNGNVTYGVPLLPDKKLNLNMSLSGQYNRNTNFTNSIKNVTNAWSLTNRYTFVTNFDKFDFTGGISGTVNRAAYSAQPKSNTTYYTVNPNFETSYVFPGNIRLAVDLDYINNSGRGEGYNTQYTLVNSYVSRQFFKNKFTFKAAVNDAFNQNQGISRTATNNTIVDLNYNVLKRYYMFSLTYSITRIGGRTIGGDMQQGGRGSRGRM